MTRRSFDDGDLWGPPVDREAVVRNGFIKAGIGVDRPPLPGKYGADSKLGWQSVASWPGQYRFLHRCDEHPRLERLIQINEDGRSDWTYYLNGRALPSLAAALLALPAAEERSRYPGHGETYLTYEPVTLQNSDLPEGGKNEVDGDLESLEAMRRDEQA